MSPGLSTDSSDSCASENAAGGNRIIDIRRDQGQISLKKAIVDGLKPSHGAEKRLSTLLLYDEAGLKLFEDITYLEEYYLTNTEIQVLEKHADDIARAIKPGSIVLELGSGNLRKVNILLQAIDRAGKAVDYYALDLSLPELERTLAEVPAGTFNNIKCWGLHGTYDDGLEWLKRTEINSKTKTVLWLGSSIGNLSRPEAAEFLKSFMAVLQPSDSMLIGIDACKDPDRVYHAYNDREGVTHRFYANGLLNANGILGKAEFDLTKWEILGQYNVEEGRHEAFLLPTEDVSISDVVIKHGEKVRIEEAYKYDLSEISTLWNQAGVGEVLAWVNDGRDYGLHLVMKNHFALPTNPTVYAANTIPTWEEWTRLWTLWDAVTLKMIPTEELLGKPIKLRNACIFYLGHIPTFFDMKLTVSTDGTPTPPDYFPRIFERGIDPDVDNPEHCHAHSEIPDEWPPLDEILAFQDRVRDRVKRLYDTGEAQKPRVARTLWLGYEHEAMHLETLLYMLVQSDKTLPPPDVAIPDFELQAHEAAKQAVDNQWFTVPEKEVILGLDDPETEAGPERHFGWDIEKPSRRVHVKSFRAQARPITIGEYAEFLQQTGKNEVPASWTEKKPTTNGITRGSTANGNANGDYHDNEQLNHFILSHSVRTVYGPVPLEYAVSWPVSASYDELRGCAAWMGGRIPTLEETRSLYAYVNELDQDPAQKAIGTMIPAVNGHLSNDGVEETPPSGLVGAVGGAVKRVVDSVLNVVNGAVVDDEVKITAKDLFVNLHGCNVGFNKWHPSPVTHKGNRLCGQGDFGGLWEWTSSTLVKHDGYTPMPLYPAYSTDFFDEKHNVILGGSWATVPRIAGRKSFMNWYQRNYRFPFAGARVVKDL